MIFRRAISMSANQTEDIEEFSNSPRSIRILSPGGGGWPTDQYYVWGFQPHFAIAVKGSAEHIFKRLDDRIIPDVFLIAINVDGDIRKPRVVIEPKDHDVKPGSLEGILDQVEHSLKNAPGPAYSYPPDNPNGESWARREERNDYLARIRKVLQQVIVEQRDYKAQLVYISAAREIDGYAVYVVLQLPCHICSSIPHLNTSSKDRFHVHTSLINAVTSAFLEACWHAMPQSIAGDGWAELPSADTVLAKAGDLFMHTACYAAKNFDGIHGGFYAFNTISTMTYERADSFGQLIISRKHHQNVKEKVLFTSPRKLQDFRAVRKLLQLPIANEALLCDSSDIYGIGELGKGYDPNSEDLFCVEFTGHGKWQLMHAGVVLMRVEYGVPSLPSDRIQAERFSETFLRLFPNAPAASVKLMREIALAATRLNHGTIIVIAPDAKGEAERFGIQSTRLEPTNIDEELLDRGSRIDGAILVSPEGICYAIGVILDGEASGKGSAERGARYNSAIRYVYSRSTSCLALVVSDDGMIDTVPVYRPLMSRREIEEQIRHLRDVVAMETITQRDLSKAMKWIEKNRFYLTETQCTEINELLQQAEPKRNTTDFQVVYTNITPHPDMNDSYLS